MCFFLLFFPRSLVFFSLETLLTPGVGLSTFSLLLAAGPSCPRSSTVATVRTPGRQCTGSPRAHSSSPLRGASTVLQAQGQGSEGRGLLPWVAKVGLEPDLFALPASAFSTPPSVFLLLQVLRLRGTLERPGGLRTVLSSLGPPPHNCRVQAGNGGGGRNLHFGDAPSLARGWRSTDCGRRR